MYVHTCMSSINMYIYIHTCIYVTWYTCIYVCVHVSSLNFMHFLILCMRVSLNLSIIISTSTVCHCHFSVSFLDIVCVCLCVCVTTYIYRVSHTTRPQGPRESHGRDYYFIDENTFERAHKSVSDWTSYVSTTFKVSCVHTYVYMYVQFVSIHMFFGTYNSLN